MASNGRKLTTKKVNLTPEEQSLIFFLCEREIADFRCSEILGVEQLVAICYKLKRKMEYHLQFYKK